MIFDSKLPTSKKSYWINSKRYIILHHTWWWTFTSMMRLASSWSSQVSWHYTIWERGEIWKIWEDNDILWHAWDNTDIKLNWIPYYNEYSIWIEVVSDWYSFYDDQKESVKKLVKYLMNKYNIPKENILRHKDITKRKWDIWDNFWNSEYSSYTDYINTNYSNMSNKTPWLYKEIERYDLFSTNEADYDKDLTAWDIKDLIEIWLYRLDLKKWEEIGKKWSKK